MKHHQTDPGCIAFVALATKKGYRNARLLTEWYRSQRRILRAFWSSEELLAVYPNPK